MTRLCKRRCLPRRAPTGTLAQPESSSDHRLVDRHLAAGKDRHNQKEKIVEQQQFEDLCKTLEGLSRNIGRIASGSGSGPDGLEAVAMSIAGEGLTESLSKAVAEAGSEIAGALERGLSEIAEAIAEHGGSAEP